MYKREEFNILIKRLKEPRKFIQVVMGPRQVGKSTLVKQVLKEIDLPYMFFAADNVPAGNSAWISNAWDSARAMLKVKEYSELILVIDEIQKIDSWSEVVKKEYDMDTFNDVNIKVLLLGSSRVHLEKGLADSLAGRFEDIRLGHWNFHEMRDAFGLSLDEFIFYGAYPGAATLIHDPERYENYIQSSIIDATLNKDILLNTPISKPALLRQTFELGASYSGKLLSLTKMLGSLQDAGNTTTLSGYLNLLKDSGLLCGLQKFSIDDSRKKASIPKFQVFNNALKMVYTPLSYEEAVLDRKEWGHILESAVGSFIVSEGFKHKFEIFYWRERNDEVDFVLKKKTSLVAIEVKGNAESKTSGLEKFKDMFHPKSAFIVGEGGLGIEEFFEMDLNRLF